MQQEIQQWQYFSQNILVRDGPWSSTLPCLILRGRGVSAGMGRWNLFKSIKEDSFSCQILLNIEHNRVKFIQMWKLTHPSPIPLTNGHEIVSCACMYFLLFLLFVVWQCYKHDCCNLPRFLYWEFFDAILPKMSFKKKHESKK